jgi:hypothetical protein
MTLMTSRTIHHWKINLLPETIIMTTIKFLTKFLQLKIDPLKIKIIIKNNILLMLILWKI